MTLRIGFDMDGVLADFVSAYREIEQGLFGSAEIRSRAADPEEQATAEAESERQNGEGPESDPAAVRTRLRDARRRSDSVWQAIHATPDFWTTLKPTEEGGVRRIQELALRHRWEVFFMTQRPPTEGDTVQRQTQRWLVDQGFDLPSVLAIAGSRGAAAGALQLDYHVDDSAQNCIDVVSQSRAKPILIIAQDTSMATSARKLRIGTAASLGQCLDVLEEASLVQARPGLMDRLASIVGWK